MTPSEEFGQLRLKFTDPIQHEYEVIRPIVLFSEKISERSSQTGIERRRVGEKAQRFVQQGMFGLVDQRAGKAGRNPHEYPEAVAAQVLYLWTYSICIIEGYSRTILAGTASEHHDLTTVLQILFAALTE